MRTGWFRDSYRHSLAARGIRTSFAPYSWRGLSRVKRMNDGQLPIHLSKTEDVPYEILAADAHSLSLTQLKDMEHGTDIERRVAIEELSIRENKSDEDDEEEEE